MAEAGVFAYPVVMAAIYGVTKLGRRERWGSMEWMRLGALAVLVGLVVSVQVKLIMIGLATTPVALLAAATSLGGLSVLLAMYFWDRWQELTHPLPKLTATLQL